MASHWRPSCVVNMVVAARWPGLPDTGIARFPALVPSSYKSVARFPALGPCFPARNRLGTAQLRGMASRGGARNGLTGPSEPGRAAGRRPARPSGARLCQDLGPVCKFRNFEVRVFEWSRVFCRASHECVLAVRRARTRQPSRRRKGPRKDDRPSRKTRNSWSRFESSESSDYEPAPFPI